MVLPQQRTNEAPSANRIDPEFRHVSGVRVGEVEILNKDPRRDYRLIDDTAGSQAVINPEMYVQAGYRYEYWPRFEGLDGEAKARARSQALQFRGSGFGHPGEKMMVRGHVLLSADKEGVKAAYAESQRTPNAMADAINPEKALARMRAEANPGESKLRLDLATDGEMSSATRFDNA
jgi:hypothetical protein